MLPASQAGWFSLSVAVVCGLLPYCLFGVNIDVVSWLLGPQALAAAISQFFLFHGQAEVSVSSVGNVAAAWVVGTLSWHILFVLFGAALAENAFYTLGLSSLAAALTAVPTSRLTGFKVYNCLEFWPRDNLGSLDKLAKLQCIGVAAGMYASAIVLPLDWDRPWQVWPCPCVIGAWFGCCLGDIAYCLCKKEEHRFSQKTA